MNKKVSKHKKRENTKDQKIIPQEQKKSSRGAAFVSVLKEFFLNFPGPGHFHYDESLTEEGKRKKDLIWGPIMLLESEMFAVMR